jgi:LytS/YehU family sensor histidine kinase
MLSQIQPHFLYNALTAIGKLCELDPPKAKTAVFNFAHYLRGNMDSLTENQLIHFSKEMDHVRYYLWLEEMRFSHRLGVVYEIEAADFSLPALTIQPIVENAVRYGLMKHHAGGTVTICAEEMENCWRVTVTDDGVGFDPSKPKQDGRSHVGIENVRRRLAAMCSGTLTVTSAPGVGTKATIEIPKGETDK